MFTSDVNSDGKADIVEIYPATQNDVVKVYFSHGETFSIDSIEISKDDIELVDNIITYGDLHGDGSNSFIFDPATYNSTSKLKMLSFCVNDKSNLLTHISNGMGQQTEITYSHLHTSSSFYSHRNHNEKPAFPLSLYSGPMYAVDSLMSDLGDLGQSLDTTVYTYKSLIVHKQGKGMLGLDEFTTNNISRDIKTTTKFDFNTSFYFPMLSKKESWLGSSPVLVSSLDNYTDTITLDYSNELIYFNVTDSTITTDELRNITLATYYNSYDDDGNVTEQVIKHENNGTLEGTVTAKTTYLGYWGNGSGCNYLPDTDTVLKWRPGENTDIIVHDNGYNSKGLLTSRTLFKNELYKSVWETVYHDDFGNDTARAVSAIGVTGRESSVSYDSKGRFPLTQTNPLLWTESFEYDHRSGQVLKATDVNGLVTKYKYDGFGRSRLTEYPDGINLIEKIAWYTGPNVSNARYYTEAQATGSPPVKAWYDRVGRELQTRSTDFAGDYVYTTMEYDSKGRKWKVSEPCDDPDNATQFTSFAYDNLGRMYQTTLPTGVKLITDFSGIANNEIRTYKQHTSSTWDDVSRTMNAFGEPVTIEEEAGGTITYNYYSTGLPKSITSNGSTIEMEYDIHGNRTSIDDPDAGEITTVYNPFDELISQTDARDSTYTMQYDLLGRITSRTGTETTAWTYSTAAGKLGQLTSVSCDNNTSQGYTYDMLGRITAQTENILGETFTQYYTYDDLGRLQSQSWNTGFGIKHKYNSIGYLDEVQTASDETIWDAESFNVRGQITSYTLGDNYRTTRDWDTYGFPEEIRTKEIGETGDEQCLEYIFNEKTGNLSQRSSCKYYVHERFRYDDLHRLVADSLGTTDYRNTDYANNGNITNRSDIGDYTYGTYGPHAVSGLEETTCTLLPANDQRVDYTDFNKASHISQGNYGYYITYGADRLRCKTVLRNDVTEDPLLTKFYAFGDYEKETDANGTRHLHYISGGDGLAAIYIKYGTGEDSLYYVMKDHLGSLVGLINSESGHVFRQSFDAWGRERNPEDWTYTDIPDDFPIARGYTGHEHLKWFGLINMNGRMYDAGLCRFLSPDPYVQMAGFTQNFNRYTYCLNNPLLFTDPSGYKWEWSWHLLKPWRLFQEIMELANDKTEKQREWMVNNNVPNFSVGYNSSQGPFHSVGNGDNVYHNQVGAYPDYAQIDQQIYEAGNEYWDIQAQASPRYSGLDSHVTTLLQTQANGNVPGHVISTANGMAAFGAFGAMGDMGVVVDSYGNSELYLTIGWAMGYCASAGMGYSKTNNEMSMDDFSGWASGLSLSVLYVGVEGYMDISQGAVRDHYGRNLKGGGGNIGVGSGIFKYFSYTITFNPPPRDFWLYPGTRR
jgi:RHS repeat-associated protein